MKNIGISRLQFTLPGSRKCATPSDFNFLLVSVPTFPFSHNTFKPDPQATIFRNGKIMDICKNLRACPEQFETEQIIHSSSQYFFLPSIHAADEVISFTLRLSFAFSNASLRSQYLRGIFWPGRPMREGSNLTRPTLLFSDKINVGFFHQQF